MPRPPAIDSLPNTLTSNSDFEPDFTSLFDGRTLASWQGATDLYRVEGGNLVSKSSGRGTLYTMNQYADFVLRFEFKLIAGANNGLVVRAPLTADPAPEAIEIRGTR